MISKKMLTVICIVLLFAVTMVIISVSSRPQKADSYYGIEQICISAVSPFQKGFTSTIMFFKEIWGSYFFLINTASENLRLKEELKEEKAKNDLYKETEIANLRLKKLLNFQQSISYPVLATQVVGRDPSPWFKTVIIDKGEKDGVRCGLPVVVAEGIIGQVIKVSLFYSRVLLLEDQNSAVDALVQRTRARGIIKGGQDGEDYIFKYVLRKDDVMIGDTILSSGLDGVFPKGLRIGEVYKVVREKAGIFQKVLVTPYVDFEKLEEVLIILIPPLPDF